MDRFKLMETFSAVARLGNYTRAATELGVTRALVSKRIKDLERSLKVRLLNRNTQRVSLTAAGEQYLERCVALLADLSEIEDRLFSRSGTVRGDIRILCSKTFGEMTLAPIVAEFSRAYPEVSIQVVLKDMGPDENDLVSRGFDMSFRTLPVADTTLVARPIAELPRVLVAAPSYLAMHGVPDTPADLTRHNCLNPNGALHYDWEFEGPTGHVAVRVSGRPRANSSIIIRHAALRGLGIAMLGEYLVADHLRDGSLNRVLERWVASERTLYVVYQKDRYQPERMRLFIDFVAEAMKSLQARQGSRSPTGAIPD